MASQSGSLRCFSPIDGQLFVERSLADSKTIDRTLDRARVAQREWRATPLDERCARLGKAVDAFVAQRDEISLELTLQMGRPVAYTPLEVGGFEERAREMLRLAPQALAPVVLEPKPGFERFIQRDPLGVVLVLAPWNFPYLTAVNAIVPALAAGNAVVLKHSSQTPLCAERLSTAFEAAGLPTGLLAHLHLSHDAALAAVGDARVDFVAFTGSVPGGRAVQRAASERFIGIGLELGGKDPAYVRQDADLAHAVETTVDGAFFNSGQSCCGIERVYVHASRFDEYVESARSLIQGYVLGDPREGTTTLGPMVRPAAADFVRGQAEEAVSAGAQALIDPAAFAAAAPGTAYCSPQLLIDVNHDMRVMREESFGPVLGVMSVRDDDEAVHLMNDSDFGLTAAVFTDDRDAAVAIGQRIETGTFFLNRCDYLDPGLAWTGVKDSGRGVTLSSLGYEVLTRPKSFHLRTQLA
ncbi:MAG: aldehyde dehydrogenase family protein [Candidatus Binatia bacterium]|nr:aldehyde dehydrogenase family protein [Candidatus Binatia bacterium]